MPPVAAHVLRLDHAPVAAAVAKLRNFATLDITPGTQARVILGLDVCKVCSGSRRCPDCGGPCEVCVRR
ncbi:MAG: hypothetical protein JWN27_2912 [Candidatus Eremiobacteraeota bacterium]|nr:hypothetical protein [Candidatus Eremiobacteraeota bacterium]